MAITPASFVPERRGVQGPDNYSVGMAKNVDAVTTPTGNTSSAESQIASFEKYPSAHFADLPASSGAGAGSVTIKTVSGAGPTNAGPGGAAPVRIQ